MNYYTPNEDEIFIGYICEKQNWKDRWEYSRIRDEDFLNYSFPSERVRTKFLDKVDIESLDFTKIDGYSHPFLGQTVDAFAKKVGGGGFNDGGRFIIVKHPKSEAIEIHVEYESSWVGVKEQLFSGEAKSINELKKILKWLKIK